MTITIKDKIFNVFITRKNNTENNSDTELKTEWVEK